MEMGLLPRGFTPMQAHQQQHPAHQNRKALSGSISDVNPWYNKAWLTPHETIRHQMKDLDNLVGKNDSFDAVLFPWKPVNFFRWYNTYFYPFIHSHHGVEEKIVMPWFARKGIKLPQKVMDDHVELLEAMDKVTALEKEYAALRARAQSPERDRYIREWCLRLRSHILRMNEHLRGHLDEEDAIYPAALKDNVKEKEWKKVEGRIIRSGGLAEGRIVMPVMYEAMRVWAGDAFANSFLNDLPAPVRYLYKTWWLPEYRTIYRPLLDGLLLDTMPEIGASGGSCGCTVM